MILFYSDYLEGCHPEILRRMMESNLEQTPGYGEDGKISAFPSMPIPWQRS